MVCSMILVALGSNMDFGERAPGDILAAALEAIETHASIVKTSRFYRSPAWPDPTEPPFTNAVAQVSHAPEPDSLLATLHRIEAMFGRVRGRRNAPRTLDLDLLDYDGRIVRGEAPGGLALPHPRMHVRDFVLAPLADIAPGWRHPLLGETAAELLAGLPERSAVPIS